MEVCAVFLLNDVVSGVNEAKFHMSTKTFGTLISQGLLVCSQPPGNSKKRYAEKEWGTHSPQSFSLRSACAALRSSLSSLPSRRRLYTCSRCTTSQCICYHLYSYIYTRCRSCNHLHVQSDFCAGFITAIPFSLLTRSSTYRLRTSIP